ncbi:MAG: hypothetical protein ACK48H_20235 [Microcystis sp.]|uniref:hypothetical protein n=1 Tax=Microcystis sp. TaxID=1127 RepID=UPI00391D4337
MLVEIRQQYKTPHPTPHTPHPPDVGGVGGVTPHTPHPTPISKFYLDRFNARFASRKWQFS